MVFPSGRRFGGAGLRRGVRTPQGSPPEILPWEGVDEANLVLALDADLSSSITVETGVSLWADQSGMGNDVVQATTSKQPTLTTLNGRGAISFDGTDDELKAASYSGIGAGSSLTIIIVAQANASPGDGYLESTSTPGNPDSGFMMGEFGVHFWRMSGSTLWDLSTTTDTNAHVSSMRHRTAQMQAYHNGTLVGTQSAGSNAMTAQADIHIGRRSNNTGTLDGHIQSVLIWNKELSNDNLDLVEARLGARFGITIS